MTLVNPQSEVIFKSKLNWESSRTGSLCLHSAALGGMAKGKFKGRTCLSERKGEKMSATIKQQDFLLETSEQKTKNLFEFFVHKDPNKRGMRSVLPTHCNYF